MDRPGLVTVRAVIINLTRSRTIGTGPLQVDVCREKVPAELSTPSIKPKSIDKSINHKEGP